jgi:signal transduction histidine kinase
MSAETLSTLFMQTSVTSNAVVAEKGFGLGLLLCKEFIDRHDGKLWVESTLGNYFLYFPKK